ncbi:MULTISPECIES: 4Fe-4S binding protein [unclassified Prevotella]
MVNSYTRNYETSNRKYCIRNCIGCMRCVSVCPAHARGIGERLNQLTAFLAPLCCERKKNELFI